MPPVVAIDGAIQHDAPRSNPPGSDPSVSHTVGNHNRLDLHGVLLTAASTSVPA